jgi:hypothetical protein
MNSLLKQMKAEKTPQLKKYICLPLLLSPDRDEELLKLTEHRCSLKGECHEIFCLKFVSWIIFPQAPDFPSSEISKFCKSIHNSRCTTGVK